MSVLEAVIREAQKESTFNFDFEIEFDEHGSIYPEDESYSMTEEMMLLKDASKKAYFFFTRGLTRVRDTSSDKGISYTRTKIAEGSVHKIAKALIDEFNENKKISHRGLNGIEKDVEKLLKYGKSKNHIGRGNHEHPDVYRRWIPSKWAYRFVTNKWPYCDSYYWILDRLENPIEGNPFAEYDKRLAEELRKLDACGEDIYKAIGYYYFTRDYYHYALKGNLQEELMYADDIIVNIVRSLKYRLGFILDKEFWGQHSFGLESIGRYTPEKHLYNLAILGAMDMKALADIAGKGDVKEKAELCVKELEGDKVSERYVISRERVEMVQDYFPFNKRFHNIVIK